MSSGVTRLEAWMSLRPWVLSDRIMDSSSMVYLEAGGV